MGFMTFEEFKTELSLNLGGVAPSPDRLSLWVNFGVYNLASYVLFEELLKTTSLDTVADQNNYPIPARMIGVKTIEVNDRKLIKLKRMPKTVDAAEPTHYYRRGSEILLWPTPDAIYTGGYIEYIEEPVRLAAAADLSPFPGIWDVAIVMLATYQALIALQRNDEADKWLMRFLGYAGSRKTHLDVEQDAPRVGLNVAWDEEDITGHNDHD